MVFHGGSGQAEPVARIEFAGRLRDLGMRVFDILRLIEHGEVEGECAEFIDVAVKQREGCENNVGVGDGAVVFFAIRSIEDEDAQLGRELAGLRRPVGDHRGGRDDEGG